VKFYLFCSSLVRFPAWSIPPGCCCFTADAALCRDARAALPAGASLVDAAVTAVLGEAEEDWLLGEAVAG